MDHTNRAKDSLDGPSADGSQSPQSVSQRGVSPALVAHARVSEELRQSEERFRLLVSSVRDYAIFLLDPAGHIVSWNEGARRLKGYEEAEIIGKHFSIFYPPEDAARGKPARGLAIAAREGRYEVEGWRVRKDGTRFWADVVITALRDGDGVLVGYGKVTRDLTERRQAEEERLELVRERSAREAADRAVELRDEFLSVAAHELKTPVTSLRLYAQATLRRLNQAGQVDPEQLRRALDTIDAQSQKLAYLMNQLLDVSRITHGRLMLEPTWTDVGALIATVVQSARAIDPQHTIDFDPDGSISARLDPTRIDQVVTNLVNNAGKYCPPGTPIEVTLVLVSPAELEIAVRDHGPGIPEARREHIFERFYPVDARNFQSGMGLGLYISREIVRQHHGQIYAEFPLDGGSLFVVRLPVDRQAERPTPVPEKPRDD